jgi:predicted GTPase
MFVSEYLSSLPPPRRARDLLLLCHHTHVHTTQHPSHTTHTHTPTHFPSHLIVYDVSVRESFQHLGTWLEEVDVFATNPNVVKLLVGNKIDKADRQVSEEEAHAFARQHAMVYIECSAKTKKGIQQTFEEIVAKVW